MEQQKPLFLESCLDFGIRKVRENRVPLLASVLFGLLAYGFNLTNKLVNWDEVECLFFKGASATSGRWGLDITEKFLPNVSMPWIYGLITIALTAFAVCIICRIFSIRSKFLQVIAAGAIMSFPSLTSTMSYMFTSSSYAIAFFLAVLAAALMRKGTRASACGAFAAMVLSLGIYQAYVAVTASLLVLMLIQRLLQEDELKTILRDGVIYVIFLALSLIGYYAATMVILRLTGQQLNSYAGGNMSITLADIPAKILLAYQRFILFFRRATFGCGLITTPLSRKMHYLLAAAAMVLMLLWVLSRKKLDLPRLLFLGAMLMILPLAINCMFLFTNEGAVHTLVLYSFTAVYLLVILLADACFGALRPTAAFLRRVCLEAISLTLAVIVVSNIYVANEASLNLYLKYENAYAFYTSLAADLKMMPEFDEDTKVAIVGEYQTPAFYRTDLKNATGMAGTAGFFPDDYSKNTFVEYYLGFPMAFVSDREAEAIAATEEYAQMPCYPYYGSMKFIDQVLVVKLS